MKMIQIEQEDIASVVSVLDSIEANLDKAIKMLDQLKKDLREMGDDE